MRAAWYGLAGLLFAGAATVPLAAQETSRTLLVRVVTEIERAPLGYSVVLAPTLRLERFTSASGVVALPVTAAGPLRLTVKRLGFTPKDTTITVGDAPSQSVTIALARVSFRLQTVRVVDWPPCKRPGLRGADAQLRGIVEQLQQNAERYLLLVRTYPFVYTVRRELGERATDGSYIAQSSDMTINSPRSEWSYRPGTLLARERPAAPGMRGEWTMRIPTIADLAEPSFVDNHCFHVAGLEEKEGARLLRLDMVAAERLKGADVNVAAWLDPRDYQLRHATFTLTKPPAQLRGLVYSTSRVEYREVLPAVPIIAQTTDENTWQEGRSQVAMKVTVERQRMQRVIFSGPRPDSLVVDSLPALPPAP